MNFYSFTLQHKVLFMNKNKKQYLQDLQEIKDTMNRASRFITLSGFSGVSTGITALVGACIAYLTVFKDNTYLTHQIVDIQSVDFWRLILISLGTLVLSITNAIYFTSRKTRKKNQNPWNIQARNMIIELSIPLITGGILCLMFLCKGFIGVLPSLTLIFYGLALINCSKYTVHEIRNLGIIEIVLGLMGFYFISYSLLFWALGFGVFQIMYGLIVQKKY